MYWGEVSVGPRDQVGMGTLTVYMHMYMYATERVTCDSLPHWHTVFSAPTHSVAFSFMPATLVHIISSTRLDAASTRRPPQATRAPAPASAFSAAWTPRPAAGAPPRRSPRLPKQRQGRRTGRSYQQVAAAAAAPSAPAPARPALTDLCPKVPGAGRCRRGNRCRPWWGPLGRAAGACYATCITGGR